MSLRQFGAEADGFCGGLYTQPQILFAVDAEICQRQMGVGFGRKSQPIFRVFLDGCLQKIQGFLRAFGSGFIQIKTAE